MKLKWTRKALSDLARLHEFLVPVNRLAAAQSVQMLTKAPTILLTNSRIGEQLFQFEPREVRRILVGQYEIRYGIQGDTLSMYYGFGIPARIAKVGSTPI